MNWDQAQGKWDQFKGEAKIRWGKLTDDQLTEIDGRRDKLVGKIEEAYGISKEAADRQVKSWKQ